MLLSFVLPTFGVAQPRAANDTTRPSVPRLALLGSGVIAGGIAVHFARYVPLWNDHLTSFHFHEDFSYALNQDKLLHAFGGMAGTRLSSSLYRWAGYDDDEALWLGAATSFGFLTFMKIEDGHIDYLGFDRVDEAANLVGVFYPVAQHYVPILVSITPKASYSPSSNDVSAANQTVPRFLEDHQGQHFWLGFTLHDLVPAEAKRYIPPIVGIAVGRAVSDLDGPHPSHEVILALDLDLRKMPGDSPFLRTLWEVLNYIHLPMPAVRISPSVVWYGIYF